MNTGSRFAGWVSFASIVMMLIGALDAIEGLVAILQHEYYTQTKTELVVFNIRTWGWVSLAWGILLVFAGYSLLRSRPWARWFTIVAGTLTFFEQLGFVGSSDYPLIAVVILALNAMVLYVLLVRWEEVKDEGF